MIIQNSISLLEQLSEIEDKIRKIEQTMESMGIEVDQERLIKILCGQRAMHPLAKRN